MSLISAGSISLDSTFKVVGELKICLCRAITQSHSKFLLHYMPPPPLPHTIPVAASMLLSSLCKRSEMANYEPNTPSCSAFPRTPLTRVVWTFLSLIDIYLRLKTCRILSCKICFDVFTVFM